MNLQFTEKYKSRECIMTTILKSNLSLVEVQMTKPKSSGTCQQSIDVTRLHIHVTY